jgi:signal transduction histidine kinase/ActR/RegA family two-component response regulator
MMDPSEASFLEQVLGAHDASGERLAARLRLGAALIALAVMLLGLPTNTPRSNAVLASSVSLYGAYALAWWYWQKRGSAYAPWMSYVSVTIDLSFGYSIAFACLYNHAGVYEVYRSPLLWLVLAAANGLTALRGDPRVGWFSFGLTTLYGAGLFAWISLTVDVPWVAYSSYLGEGLNMFEAFQAQLFVTAPALIAVRVSQRANKLAIDAARRERVSEDERAKLAWRLKVADRMVTVGTMAAGIAHEVNNPLTYVLHNLDLAMRRVLTEPSLADLRVSLDRAHNGTQRVQGIVAALRTFSRIDEGPRHPVDLRSTIDAALTMASSELKHRARVDIEQGETVFALGSEAKLGQLFLNLIVNAAQSIAEPDPNRQRIGIFIGREGERAVVEISDTGAGIAPEHRPRIFDPFFTTKPVGSGTGLGLSICHSIVTELSGSIDVQSEPGKGSTFRVTLPWTRDGVERTSTVRPVAQPRPEGRVLVIDDDPMVGEAVELMLSEEHDVVLAQGADEALSMIRAGQQFDAIVCDLMMPGMSGIELYLVLERDYPGYAGRMLFATGGAFTRSAQSFVQRMGERVITKPFRSDELRRKVGKLVVSSLSASSSAQPRARDGAAHK